jgi:hypothetical protein
LLIVVMQCLQTRKSPIEIATRTLNRRHHFTATLTHRHRLFDGFS